MKITLSTLLVAIIVLSLSACDSFAPVITGNQDITYNINAEEPDWTTLISAEDVEDGEIIITDAMVSESVDFTTAGTYSVTYTVPDSSGKSSTYTIQVTIVDNRTPTFELLDSDEMTIEINTSYDDPGVNALDKTGEIAPYTVSGDVDAGTLGDYTITYTMDGTDISLTRIIHVVDTEAPVANVTNFSADVGTVSDVNWMDYISVSDNSLSDVSVTMTDNDVNFDVAGYYSVHFDLSDIAGNTSHATILVNITPLGSLPTSLSGDPVEITFWHVYGQSRSAVLDDQIVDFINYIQTTYGVTVTVNSVSQGTYTDLNNSVFYSILADQTPTMTLGYATDFMEYHSADSIVALDGFITDETWGLDITDFVNSFVEENQQYDDGHMYTLPFLKSTEVLLFNKTLFEANGINVPTDGSITWADLDLWAQTMVGSGSNQCDYLINYDSASNFFISSARMWGAGYTDSAGNILVNDTTTIEMLNYINTRFINHTFVLPIAWGESYGSTHFQAGDACMTVTGTPELKYSLTDTFEIGVAPVPQYDLNQQVAMQQGPNIAIMKGKTKDETLIAWLLVKWLTETENNTAFALDMNYLPVRTSAFSSASIQDLVAITDTADSSYYVGCSLATTTIQLPYLTYDIAFTGSITSTDAKSQAELLMQSIYSGISVEDAIANMIANLS